MFRSTFVREKPWVWWANRARVRAALGRTGPALGRAHLEHDVRLEGRDLLAASRAEMRQLRRDLPIIFQDTFASLDPRYRVEDNTSPNP